jgi:uncharacterized protein (TIGR00661 family)
MEEANNIHTKTILFCPLDWGLGHASRDIYIIHKLIEKQKFKIIIAADKGPYVLLKNEFPDLQFIRFPSVQIRYSRLFSMVIQMMIQFPKLLWGVFKEHKELKSILKKENIDIVISDHRYGLWNKKIQSIFITHQLRVRFPQSLRWAEPIFFRLSNRFIRKYDYCWVPDFPGENNLAGELSHPVKLPDQVHFIGPVSRFIIEKEKKPAKIIKKFDVLVILSGPEPQRTILENSLINRFQKLDYKVLIVRGIPWAKTGQKLYDHIQLVSHLSSDLLLAYIKEAKFIICRSGYSSLMDLSILGKTALIIPTPGQTEQEYLADRMNKKMYFLMTAQPIRNLENLLEELKGFKPEFPELKPELLDEAIGKLLNPQ